LWRSNVDLLMEAPMLKTKAFDYLAIRKSHFLQFRWLLVIWAMAVLASGARDGGIGQTQAWILIGILAASQVLLWSLPFRFFEGMWLTNGLFLFDLNLIILCLHALGKLQSELMVALFLGIFISAMAQKVSLAMLIAAMVSAVYLGLEARTATGFDFSACNDCLVNLPFLLISSMHAGLLAQEAKAEALASKILKADKHLLASHMQVAFLESAEYALNMTLLLDNFNFALVMVDMKGTVKAFNTMAEYSFGLERIKALNSPLENVPALADLTAVFQKCLAESVEDDAVLKMPQNEGVPWFMNLRSLPLRNNDGQTVGVILMLTPTSFKESLPAVRRSFGAAEVHAWEAREDFESKVELAPVRSAA
jgi:hypothetical protein